MPLIGKRVKRPVQRGLLAATYLPSILKGMWITFRHLFRPKVTMQYPEQTWTLPENYRGLPAARKRIARVLTVMDERKTEAANG